MHYKTTLHALIDVLNCFVDHIHCLFAHVTLFDQSAQQLGESNESFASRDTHIFFWVRVTRGDHPLSQINGLRGISIRIIIQNN
jgi:hypothetical protein